MAASIEVLSVAPLNDTLVSLMVKLPTSLPDARIGVREGLERLRAAFKADNPIYLDFARTKAQFDETQEALTAARLITGDKDNGDFEEVRASDIRDMDVRNEVHPLVRAALEAGQDPEPVEARIRQARQDQETYEKRFIVLESLLSRKRAAMRVAWRDAIQAFLLEQAQNAAAAQKEALGQVRFDKDTARAIAEAAVASLAATLLEPGNRRQLLPSEDP